MNFTIDLKQALRNIWHLHIAISYQKIIQNSTSSGNWTSVKMLWKAPQSYEAGNITFRYYKIRADTNANPIRKHTGHILVTAMCWKI